MDKNYGYKHTKGFIVFILLFIICIIGEAYGQVISGSPNTPSGYSIDSQTGNLLPNGALTSATGWSSTSGSPLWTPNASPLGSFSATDGYTFSYIREELGVAGINLSGISHGYLNSNAVFVTGFSYGLKYRFPCANSIGTNCDGTSQTAAPANPLQDNLRVEIGYYPASGANDFLTHQLGLKNISDGNPAYNPNWQTLASTYTFSGAKPLSQAGAINMSIIGEDAGGWACLNGTCYGPQIKDAYLRANYSVDPCILNPAFNPSCTGFNNIIQYGQSPIFANSYNIATSLPHIGGGVQLHGYEYGFNWANFGSCYASFLFWCTDWRTDGGGNVNFRVSDKFNNTLIYDQQYRAGNSASGSYYNRIVFTESRNSLDMGSVQWWTDSVYNNFAVSGWTRPIWTPDPCYSQPLYSPNCSNFNAEIKRIAADLQVRQQASLASVTTSSTSTTPTSNIITTINDATSTSPTVTVTTENILSTPSTTNNNGNQNSNLQTSIIANNTPSQNTSSQPIMVNRMDSTNTALSIISRNQERDNISLQTSQQAVRNAQTVANQSIRDAENIALDIASKSSTTNTNTVQQDTAITDTRTSNQNSMFSLLPQTTTNVNQNMQSSATNSQSTIFNQSQGGFSASIDMSASNQVSVTSAPSAITMYNMNQQSQQNGITTNDVNNSFTTMTLRENTTSQSNFLTDKSNPMNDVITGNQQKLEQPRQLASIDTVKKNVQDNEAAGGVSINTIATQPQGYNLYTQLVYRDVAFYAPKEIYRGQRNVDNARALRQLASDRLHQEMVDQQYRR